MVGWSAKRTQRVNKLFSRGRGAGAPLAWQVWGGRSFHMDRWSESGKKTRPAKRELAGRPFGLRVARTLSWAATGYGYDNQAVGKPADATAGRVDHQR